jgi:hypothetical protein
MSFVATNCDESVARVIDSYNALASDLHLLTAPKQSTSPYRAELSTTSFQMPAPLRASRGHYQSLSMSASYNSSFSYGMSYDNSSQEVSHNGASFKHYPCASSISDYMSSAHWYKKRARASAELAHRLPPPSPSTAAKGALAKCTIDVANIVDSQMASGRFKISGDVREKLVLWNVPRIDDSIMTRVQDEKCVRLGHSDTQVLCGTDDVKPSRVNTRPTRVKSTRWHSRGYPG